ALLDLFGDHTLRGRYIGGFHDGGQRPVAYRVELLDALDPGQPGTQVVTQLGQRVELARQLGEVVVERRQLLLLHPADGDRHIRRPAGQLAAHQLRAEGGRGTRGEPHDRVVQPGQQLVAAELVGDIGGGAARYLLAVDRGRQVDLDEVADLGRPVHRLQRGEPVAQRAELLVDLGVTDLDLVDRHRDRAQVGQAQLGAHVQLGGEL